MMRSQTQVHTPSAQQPLAAQGVPGDDSRTVDVAGQSPETAGLTHVTDRGAARPPVPGQRRDAFVVPWQSPQ